MDEFTSGSPAGTPREVAAGLGLRARGIFDDVLFAFDAQPTACCLTVSLGAPSILGLIKDAQRGLKVAAIAAEGDFAMGKPPVPRLLEVELGSVPIVFASILALEIELDNLASKAGEECPELDIVERADALHEDTEVVAHGLCPPGDRCG